jgi:biofilm PGA synthesis N-glycosyltransferase PgaC
MSDSLFTLFRNIAFVLATAMLLKYWVFLLVAPFYSVKEGRRKLRLAKNGRLKTYNPLISIIVPAWNEEVGIIKTIQSIIDNSYQHIELLVVNDGSSDNSDTVVRKYIDRFNQLHPERIGAIRYAYKQNGGKGKALNHGINYATGEIIMTVDADSALEKLALERLKNYFADPTISAVVGNVKISHNTSFIGFVQKLEYLFGFYFKRSHAFMGSEYIFGGACAAFRKEIFDQHGLFDDKNKTEDIEMSMRIRSRGLHCTYAEDVVCYTEGASTVSGLINQRLRWKKGRFDTFGRYRQLFFSLRRGHNKMLTIFVLPFALLAEIQLLVEPISIALLVTYSLVSADFLSLAFGLLFVFSIYLVNALFGSEGVRLKTLLLFPFSWPIFYLLIWIEFLALIRSISMVYQGNDVQWQQWKRQGISEISVEGNSV